MSSKPQITPSLVSVKGNAEPIGHEYMPQRGATPAPAKKPAKKEPDVGLNFRVGESWKDRFDALVYASKRDKAAGIRSGKQLLQAMIEQFENQKKGRAN